MDISTDRGFIGSHSATVRKLNRISREVSFKGEYIFGTGLPNRLLPIMRPFMTHSISNIISGWHKFYHFRKWSQNEIAHIFGNYLRETNFTHLENYFNLPYLKANVSDHIRGKVNSISVLDTALTLDQASKKLFKPNSY